MLPEKYHDDIQKLDDRGYVIYFMKNGTRIGCGYFGKTKEDVIKNCSIEALDKFADDYKPASWDELEVFKLKGL